MINFKHRHQIAELLDNEILDIDLLKINLTEINTINAYLGGNRMSMHALKPYLNEHFEIWDIGCGNAEFLKQLQVKSQSKLNLIGIDSHKLVYEIAKESVIDLPNIKVFHSDFMKFTTFTNRKVIAHSCLLWHHLSNQDIMAFIKHCKQNNVDTLIVNDLHRHPLAYWGIKLILACFKTTQYVKHDAPVSVLRSFKKHELLAILKECDIHDYQIKWKWAFRWLLIIKFKN